MNKPQRPASPDAIQTSLSKLFPALIALSLLVMLFPIPQARMVSNHTWRAELVTTLMIPFGVIAMYWRDRGSIAGLFVFDNVGIRLIVAGFAAFTFWGLLSALWSPAPFPALHHTIVWTEFILVFLIARRLLADGHGMGLISGVFLWVAAIIGVLCLIDYVTLPDFKTLEGVIRARYSAYGEMLGALLPVVWALGVYTKARSKYLLTLFAGILGWTTVMLSLSKGAFIAGVIGFALFFAGSLIFGLRRFRPRLLVSFGIWLAVTVAVQIGFSFLTAMPATVDYISGKADTTRETSIARIFIWRVGGEMVADHWLKGVGADNFGVAFNESRAKFRVSHPDNPNDEIVGENLVKRSHNELLQITTELGIVGLILVLIPLFVFAWMLLAALKTKDQRPKTDSHRPALSPMLWAAVAGMLAFGVSSMVSSFSLRIVQNGLVFFIVFAIAVHEAAKAGRARPTSSPETTRNIFTKAISVGMIVLLAVAITTLSLKAAAEYFVLTADREMDNGRAIELYRTAVALDPDYKAAHFRISSRNYGQKDFAAAATGLRKAIDGGLGTILTYANLTDCETNLGDAYAVEKTYLESLRIFPRSVFLRVRYALFLQKEGLAYDSEKQMAMARSIDGPQAAGWYKIMTDGSVATFLAAQMDPNIAYPADLKPEAAVLQYLDKEPGDE